MPHVSHLTRRQQINRSLVPDSTQKAYSGLLSSFLRLIPRDWKMLSAAVLGADVLFGVAFVTVTIVVVTVVRVIPTSGQMNGRRGEIHATSHYLFCPFRYPPFSAAVVAVTSGTTKGCGTTTGEPPPQPQIPIWRRQRGSGTHTYDARN